MISSIRILDVILEKFCSWGLIISIVGMLLFSIMTIVMRWFGVTFLWIDPLVRHLVFFSAFLGGAMASSRGSHIKIDLIAKLIESKNNEFLLKLQTTIISIIVLIALVWLAISSYEFGLVEMQFGREAFLGIHSGTLVMLIPWGFALIALRTFVSLILVLTNTKKLGEV